MYRLMVSFDEDDFKGVCLVKPKEYILPTSDDVCKVITSLSHLKPIIPCVQIPVFNADEVLKDFEIKKV